VTEDEARAILQRFGRFVDLFADCFGRRVQRDAASRYLTGLFNDSARKSMQAMHGRLSDAGPCQALQHFTTDWPCPTGPLWARPRDLIPERGGVLAVDDTGFPKQGRHSVGVKRQYCGALGKTGNCQVGVTTALTGPALVWPTSGELSLPKAWAADADRREKARVPAAVRLREKWLLALAHVRTVKRAGLAIEAVVADADYGTTTAFRTGLERMELRYALAARSHLTAWTPRATTARTLEAIGRALPAEAWRRVSWGQGTTGPLAERFVARRVHLRHGCGERWVLFERSLADDARKYYLLNLEGTASLEQLVRLARSRWPIGQQYRELRSGFKTSAAR
jgi:SRSO17 transposase